MDATSIASTIRVKLGLQPGERLYTIVDACQDAELAFEAESCFGQTIQMMFVGAAAVSMRDVAPYVVSIDLENDYLEHWAARWGKNVGILLISSAAPHEVYLHLRQVFVVKDEHGQEYFFRYYDPRVLRVFLPTCSEEELKDFFGPMRVILCVGDDAGVMCRFSINRDGTLTHETELLLENGLTNSAPNGT